MRNYYFSYTRPLPVMQKIVQTIEYPTKKATAQTAHLFFANAQKPTL